MRSIAADKMVEGLTNIIDSAAPIDLVCVVGTVVGAAAQDGSANCQGEESHGADDCKQGTAQCAEALV
jgi:hypothetical protein